MIYQETFPKFFNSVATIFLQLNDGGLWPLVFVERFRENDMLHLLCSFLYQNLISVLGFAQARYMTTETGIHHYRESNYILILFTKGMMEINI